MSTPTLAVPAIVLPAVVTHDAHACRWCGVHDCGVLSDHDRLFASGETYYRMTLAERNVCPTCSGDVRDRQPCVSLGGVA